MELTAKFTMEFTPQFALAIGCWLLAIQSPDAERVTPCGKANISLFFTVLVGRANKAGCAATQTECPISNTECPMSKFGTGGLTHGSRWLGLTLGVGYSVLDIGYSIS